MLARVFFYHISELQRNASDYNNVVAGLLACYGRVNKGSSGLRVGSSNDDGDDVCAGPLPRFSPTASAQAFPAPVSENAPPQNR